jgi:uncharacterized protein YqgC (DUF456 family)
MEILLVILSIILLVGGIAGCILPILPGVPLAYAGVLLMHWTDKVHFSTTQLVVWLVIVIVLQILDYISPILGSKYGGGTSHGNRGCMAGTILGLFFMPWGIILGPFLGAVVGEVLGGSDLPHAVRAGVGSLIGFMLGTLLKIFVCFYWLVQCVAVLV